MKRYIKKLSIGLALLVSLMLPAFVLVPQTSFAQDCDDGVGRGIGFTSDDGSCADEDGDGSFQALVKRVINIFSIVVGAVSVIMIIIGGFRYIISGGDSNGVTGAKNTLLYAIIGLVIVLFAQVIVRFVFTNSQTSQ